MDVKTLRASVGTNGKGVSGFDGSYTIDTVLERHFSPTGEHGPWSIQNLVVSDATGKIKMVLKNQEAVALSAVGQNITVKCKDVRGVMMGTKIEEDSYDAEDGSEKKVVQLIVTKSAQVIVGNVDGKSKPSVAETVLAPINMEECFKQAAEFLTRPSLKDFRNAVVHAGWSSEDLRAFAVTIYLDLKRK